MIKRVIFDIDNTLIDWKTEYDDKVKEVLTELNEKRKESEIKNLQEAINEYENYYLTFNLDKMVEFVREYTNIKYSKEVIQKILDMWGTCVPESYSVENIDTLKYLKNKYELVILTDWFLKPQLNRLKLLKIDKFFSEIYTAENAKRKPNKEAFFQAIGEYKPEECIMIGDSYERDVIGAINSGLYAVWYRGKKELCENLKEKVTIIEELSDLKDIL